MAPASQSTLFLDLRYLNSSIPTNDKARIINYTYETSDIARGPPSLKMMTVIIQRPQPPTPATGPEALQSRQPVPNLWEMCLPLSLPRLLGDGYATLAVDRFARRG